VNNQMFEPIVTVLAGIVGLALVAVLVSQKSNTSGVFAAAGGAFSNAISAAVSPVTGNSAAPNVNAGVSNNGMFGGSGGSLLGGQGTGGTLSLNLFG
jgi:hypothetical protein